MASECRVCGKSLQPPSIRRNPNWGVTQWENETYCKGCLDPELPTCPFCLKAISDDAIKCSYCGSEIERVIEQE